VEYPVYKGNSAEFLVEFCNFENFLSWNKNVIQNLKGKKWTRKPFRKHASYDTKRYVD